ncbi:putative sodium-coupled neutral amino acid transporter 7 [Dendronephthya gigantea]|uniref:putative sodium-coupled neutral amino acid transporter 7 n=1 Tax=Dendronephthya gigantea TaxID=151771 RepID=UPI0010694E4B|nr:putative sodium-coupled neutral amino acid transporter 7 [Dendronephthya gigantea]
MGNERSKLRTMEDKIVRSDESNYFSPFGGSSTEVQYNSINSSSDDPVLASGSSTSSRTRAYGLPLHRAVVVVANAALGAGMLNFPEAYEKSGGLAYALTVQTCLVLLIIGSFFILGYCGRLRQTKNYQDTIRDYCGPIAQVVCQINVVLYMFGCNVTHMILIGDQLTKAIDHDGWYFDRRFVITVVCCVFILPLCIPEKLKAVSYSSLVGGFGAIFVCCVVVSRYYTGSYSPPENSSEKKWSSSQIFAAVPVICFGFQCHVTAVAVYAELRRPTLVRFGLVTFLATLICAVLYSLTGSYGYLTFKHNVNSDILVNYRHGDHVATSARVFIVLVVFSTFAICQFVGRSAIIGLWCNIRKLTAAEIENYKGKRRVITSIIWFFSSLGIAVIVPTIADAIAIVGALAAHFIFTFPGLCLIQLMLQDYHPMEIRRKLGLAIGIIYVVIGMFLFGVTVTAALMSDIEGKYLA